MKNTMIGMLLGMILFACQAAPGGGCQQGPKDQGSSGYSSSSSSDPTIGYDNGVPNRVIFDPNPGLAYYFPSVFFTPAKIGNAGKNITSVKFYYSCEPNTTASIAVYIIDPVNYQPMNAQPVNYIYVQSVSVGSIVNGWNTVTLNTPVKIPSGGVWVELEIVPVSGNEGCEMDSSPGIYYNGNNVNQIDGVAADSVGDYGNWLIEIGVQ